MVASKFSLVDIEDISSKRPRSDFSTEIIENLAQAIIECEGLLKPLILSQSSIESYDVLDNHLEFYAALRAFEINSDIAEKVNAFIVSKKHLEKATQQLKICQGIDHSPVVIPPHAIDRGNDHRITNIETRQNNFEMRIEKTLQEEKNRSETTLKRLEAQIEEMKKCLPEKVDALEMFNTFEEYAVARKFCSAKIANATANKLAANICKEREKRKFTSFQDVVNRVTGLGDKTMLRVLDVCSGLS